MKKVYDENEKSRKKKQWVPKIFLFLLALRLTIVSLDHTHLCAHILKLKRMVALLKLTYTYIVEQNTGLLV